MSGRCPHLDRILGVTESITRRDFLDGVLLASGTALTASALSPLAVAQESQTPVPGWNGYTGEGDYRSSAGNTEEVIANAHAVRDGVYDAPPSNIIETNEVYDCVVVGGGFSGLSAGFFFHKRASANRNCLIVDNARIFGGVAKRNEFLIDGHRLYAPQASVHFQPPYPNSFLETVYDGMGLDWSKFRSYQDWDGPKPEIQLPRSPYGEGSINDTPALGFYFGAKYGKTPGVWVTDPWGKKLEDTPFSEQTRRDLLALHNDKPVNRPLVYDYPGDPISRELDSMTYEDYLIRTYGVTRDSARLFAINETTGGFGMGPDVLSAFLYYEWSKTIPTIDDSMKSGIQMFPGGNSGMTRLLVKTIIPNAIEGPKTMEAVWKNPVNFAALDAAGQRVRLRLNSTAVRVEHIGEPNKSELVSIIYIRDGRLYRVKAKTVVMAGGGWITKHVVCDLDENRRSAYGHFYYAPYMTANVAVRNWRFLYNMGLSSAQWFEGFARYVNVRKCAKFGVDSPVAGPDHPTVLTFFVDFAKPGLPIFEQEHRGRMQLLNTPFAEYERQIREQLSEMFHTSGFDAKRDIAGIVLNRFGHAFINPQPGFFFGLNGNPAPREALRNGPFGRIAFSHCDLAGAMDHRNAFIESSRAVGQLLDRVLV
jgi:spermidine dehydrogenase